MIAILTDQKLEHLQKEIRFTFEFIFGSLGYEHKFIDDLEKLRTSDILVIYGFNEPTVEDLRTLARRFVTLFIPADAELFDPKVLSADKLRKNLREVKLLSLTPVLSARKFDYAAHNISDEETNAGKISFDLVGNVFFHLAGLDEKVSRAQSTESREAGSVFFKYRETPYVDNLLWLMDSMIKEHSRARGQYIVQKQYWPQGQEAAVILTHSVDDLQKWDLASMILSIADDFLMLISMNWQQLWHTTVGKFKYLFTNYELNWNFDEFRRLEHDAGMKSTFFIATHSCDDIDYNLDDADLQEEIRSTLASGNEVGFLMTSDKRNRDIQLTRKQVLLHQLKQDSVGVRQFGYEPDDELQEIRQTISPLYSMSTARQENPGYPRGIGIPYFPWLKTGKAEYQEIPTLFRDSFLKVSKHKIVQLDDAKTLIKKFYQAALRTRGIFSQDFRIASFTDLHHCAKLYPYILAMTKTNKTWVATAMELSKWWQARSKVVIDEGEYEFSVFFPVDMDSFTLTLNGDYKIVETDGPSVKVDGNHIRYTGVKAETVSIVRLQKNT
ncbi:MAG TPA: hypothetical protein PL124_05765 [Candidatus Cloacimonadota bacterium]|nr:hypothetical protein [Candidatus Cloacimonadota bacterium]